MSSTPCPTCGRHDFADDSYMKRHHAQVHGESIAGFTTTCTECEETIVKETEQEAEGNSFCDMQCLSLYRSKQTGEDSHRWEGGIEERECVVCGTSFTPKYRYRETCSGNCFSTYRSEIIKGEDNPNWKGGYDEYYGEDWLDARERIRERDGNTCQVCGESSDNWIPVHHVIPVRTFDNPNDAHFDKNMAQVCRSCHPTVEALSPEKQNSLLDL